MKYLHILMFLLIGMSITTSISAQTKKEFSETELFKAFLENFDELELPHTLVSKDEEEIASRKKEIDTKFADYVPELLRDQVKAEEPRPHYFRGIVTETNQYVAVICETPSSYGIDGSSTTYSLITYSKKSVALPSDRVISSEIICEPMRYTTSTIEEDLSVMLKSPQYTGFTTKSPYAISKLQILPSGKIEKMGESRKK